VKNILIIGATSEIAANCAKIWALESCSFYLVARNKHKLSIIKDDLLLLGANKVYTFTIDLSLIDELEAMVIAAFSSLKTIDVALIAHGTLPNQKLCEESSKISLQEININALSVVTILTILANLFELQKYGMLAVISSVAGDRGRQSNYVYGSSKALISAFSSGLRQRLIKSNVYVLTIKPGYVDSAMTHGINKGFLWTKPVYVARQIVRACSSSGGIIYCPRYWMSIMFLIKSIPENIFKKLKI